MDCKAGQALKAQIYQKVKQLIQQGHEISVCWVPSHCKVEGNERADKAAKEAAGRERIRTARWTSLTHLKRQVTKEKKSQLRAWHKQKTRERESRKSGFYVPSLKAEMDPLLGENKKVLCIAILPTENRTWGCWHVPQKNRSNRDRRVLVVWRCRAIRHTPVHKVSEMASRTASFKEELGKVGIQWQRRPEKRWLAKLLADRYAVGPVLEFLKNTEVGSRDGGAERENEWEQRRDQDGEDQLGEGEQKVLKGRIRSNKARAARQSEKET